MVQERIQLSLVISAKDVNDPKLKELLASIDRQDFPKDQLEVLVITEGTSESAKAIGIRKARGEVIGILAGDNQLVHHNFLNLFYQMIKKHNATCIYPGLYTYNKSDDSLNRYFSLIGGNDPLSYYMGKNDKLSRMKDINTIYEGITFNSPAECPTLGDNGFFVIKDRISETDLDNYFHIDNASELFPCFAIRLTRESIWHKTGGNIFKFFAKRYRYGLQHAFNRNRRWHLVDFQKPQDIWRLVCFVVLTLSVIQPLMLSIRGWLKIQDKAWFLHWPVCMLTLGTYAILVIHHVLRRLTQSLSAPMAVQRA